VRKGWRGCGFCGLGVDLVRWKVIDSVGGVVRGWGSGCNVCDSRDFLLGYGFRL
jgi:hypothetical protein